MASLSSSTLQTRVPGSEEFSSKHFILIHGACHGAWSWYKVKPLLESAGHEVTSIDMAASGIDGRRIEDLTTIEQYNEPLMKAMDSLPSDRKVVLVGHSLGGLNIALAADKFPEKVSVMVFLAAFMPDLIHGPSYVLEQYWETTPIESWEDTKFESYGDSNDNLVSMFFGPLFMSKKLYQLCSPQDLTLGSALIRPSSLFMASLTRANKFSEQGYGIVPRAYIVCKEDRGIPIEYQRWLVENIGVNEVKEMEHTDHMAMLSSPDDLCLHLLDIANKYE